MLDALIESQGPRLFSLCCKLCRSRSEAEDLYQETWLRALQKQAQLLQAEKPGAYLARICLNLFRDRWRRRKFLCFFSMSQAEGQAYVEARLPVPGPQEEDAGALRQAVNALPEPYRQAVLLYYFCEQSIEEAAAILGVPPGTVKSRLSRGRKMLKEVLADG